MGRREQNKLDKLHRIKMAARATFIAQGYDDATSREIAQRAKIAVGTLFLYAANKRDLLFLVVNEDFEAIGRRAAKAVRDDATLLENLMNTFATLYEFFSKNPQLSRFLLREMFFYEGGVHADQLARTRERMIETVVGIVKKAQAHKELGPNTDAELAGRTLFAVYQLEVRTWLSGDTLRKADGLARLEKSLRAIIVGFAPTGAALQRSVKSRSRVAQR